MTEDQIVSSHSGGASRIALVGIAPLLLGFLCWKMQLAVGSTILPPLWLPFGLSVWIFLRGCAKQKVAVTIGNILAFLLILGIEEGRLNVEAGLSAMAAGILSTAAAAPMSRFMLPYFVRHEHLESSVVYHPIRFLRDFFFGLILLGLVSFLITAIWGACGVIQGDFLLFKTAYYMMSLALGGTSLLPLLIMGKRYFLRERTPERRPHIGIGAFAIGLVILVWLLNSLAGRTRDRRFQTVNEKAGVLTEEIRRNLEGVAGRVWALRNLWDSSVLVDRHEFLVFSKDSLESEDSLIAMGWAPLVQSEDFNRLEETARVNSKWGETLEGIEILSSFALQNKEVASEMLPAFFVEPLIQSTWLIGIDFLEAPGFSELVKSVRKQNEVGISRELEMEGRSLRAVAAWVTRPSIVPFPFDSPEDWIQNLDGLVFGVMDLSKLIENARQNSGITQGEVMIYDITDDPTIEEIEGESNFNSLSVSNVFETADRQWRTKYFLSEGEIGQSEFGAFAGAHFGVLFSSGLFGLTLFIAIGYTDRIEREVRSRTRELRESEERFRQISENVREVFWIASRTGTEMIYLSPAFEPIWGNSRERVYEDLSLWFEPIHEEDRSRVKEAFRLKAGKGEYEEIYRITQPDGSERWIRDRGFPVMDEKGELTRIVGVAEDVSREKEVELELKRSNAELAEFAYVASHDLREPLRMVTSFVQLLERHCDEFLDAKARQYMDFITDGAQRMRTLIDDLLELSRIGSAGKEFGPVEANQLVETALSNLSVAIGESGAHIKVQKKLPRLLVDEGQFVRVFQNLIANAIKFSGDKSPEIEIRAKLGGRFWNFEIEDNGVGFPEDQCVRIFAAFQRYKNYSTEINGSGIGLAVCKRVVERHGGTIGVSSIEGEGSIFRFSVPLVLYVES